MTRGRICLLLFYCFSIIILPFSENGGNILFLSANAQSAKGAIEEVNYLPEDIISLIKKSRNYYYEKGDMRLADSLASEAISKAEMTYRIDIILYALNNYLSMNELGYDQDKAVIYAKRAENIVYQSDNVELVWRTYINLAMVWQSEFEFEKALGFGHKALSTCESVSCPEKKARSFLCLGEILQSNNQYIEGFRYFLNALSIAESSKDPELLIRSYKALSRFYNLTKVYDKAVSYKMREIDVITSGKPVDSLALVWAWTDLEDLSLSFNNTVHEEKLCDIISFAVKENNSYLKQYVLAMFRSYLMQNDKFDKLVYIYTEKYPEEMAYLMHNQPLIYYRVKAIIHEVEGLIDSAHFYYDEALKMTRANINKVMAASFNIRYGEFLQRRGMVSEAIERYLEAFNQADEVNYLEFSLKAAGLLKELYTLKGDYEKALFFSENERRISDIMAQIIRNDEMLALEIQNTAQLRELAVKEDLLSTQRRNNIQYSLMILMIIALFLILIMVGSFRVSPTLIHLLGFVTFIFLFEFIILLADNQIHYITHGEPLKVIGLKIVLISFMLPLHHWVQKRATRAIIKRGIPIRKTMSDLFNRLRHSAKEIWLKWE